MAKEIIIPQGTYTVGVDFPEGAYVFDSLKEDGILDLSKANEDEDCFYLDKEHGYNCRLTLANKDSFAINTQMKVSKAEMIVFD